MTEGVATLVRIYRTRLNDARRALAELNREQNAILGERARLLDEYHAEKLFAATSLEAGTAFVAYYGAMQERQKAMGFLLDDVERRMGEANDHIATIFRELKKYEITAEQRALEKAREAARREQLELDELGLEIYRRRVSKR